MKIWDANPKIVDKLREAGRCCTRRSSRTATCIAGGTRRRSSTAPPRSGSPAWTTFRDTAGASPPSRCARRRSPGIEATQFFPAWGKARLHGMIANRPDWTLSRQRQWGMPLPFFVDQQTDELHPDTPALLELAAAKVEQGGIEAWFEATHEDFGVDPARYRKLTDTLDVWFDSGSTHQTVLDGSNPRSHCERFPADLYLEGSDQHRGWFHSSLLSSCMLNGGPPYKALLTHGFAVDGEGKKMSKSKGNVVAPQKVSDTLGAEILRLWVGGDRLFGRPLDLRRDPEARRRELSPHPQHAALPARQHIGFRCGEGRRSGRANWFEIDRYALAQARVARRRGRGRLRPLRVPPRRAAAADLLLGGPRRLLSRRAQGPALHRAAGQSRAALGADRARADPRCAAEADGADPLVHRRGSLAHRSTPTSRRSSRTWSHGSLPELPQADALLAKWQRILAVRAAVLKELEALREQGKIGSSLQAEVTMAAPDDDYEALASLGDDLRFVLITSAARVERSATRSPSRSIPVPHAKCERCWHWRGDVGDDARAPAAVRALRGQSVRRRRTAQRSRERCRRFR